MGNMYTYTKAPKENTTLCKRLAKEGMHVQQYKYPSSDYIGTFPHHKNNSTN